MLVDNFQTDTGPAQIPFAPGYGDYTRIGAPRQLDEISESQRRSYKVHPSSRMIRSVVDEAGLGRFMYLQGRSGRRYVFSSVGPKQVSLYSHALFATATAGDCTVHKTVGDVVVGTDVLYVHLLDDGDEDGLKTLEDLGLLQAA